MGAQLSNQASFMEITLKTNQGVAAKFLKDQKRDLRQIARDRQDITQNELQLKQPDQLLITRAAEDQQKEYKRRAEKGKEEQAYNKYRGQLKTGRNVPSRRPVGNNRVP